jgi:hypothetical protein
MAGMESNHTTGPAESPPAAEVSGEIEGLLTRMAAGDPADAAEPAARIADLLGSLLETEDDPH